MAHTPYVPNRQSVLKTWAENFAELIAASPARYGLAPADAATIQSYVGAFAAASDAARRPATRTRSSVADKDAKRAAMLGVVRPYAQRVRNNAGVGDDDKIALGVRPLNAGHTPVLVPQTQPLLSVVGATPGVHTLRFADANTPASRAKPFGATYLQVNVGYGGVVPSDVSETVLVGLFTRQPLAVSLPAARRGQRATYFARWVGVRGDTGPWSPPASMTVAF